MALSGVKCTVNNCKYNQDARQCTAAAIEVTIDGGASSARQPEQTNCHTFEGK